MASPFYLIWKQGLNILRGYEGSQWIDGQLTFPIIYPGMTTAAQAITLSSSAAFNQTFETMTDVAFYLTGTDVPTVQGQWPYLTDSLGQVTPESTGGFEISFDGGTIWTRFSNTVGLLTLPATWIALPQVAVGFAGSAGQIGAFDMAHLLVRYVIPPSVTLTRILDIQLAVDCDVV